MGMFYECPRCRGQYSEPTQASSCCAGIRERELIVAWLRSSPFQDEWENAGLLQIATHIEAGEHLK